MLCALLERGVKNPISKDFQVTHGSGLTSLVVATQSQVREAGSAHHEVIVMVLKL